MSEWVALSDAIGADLDRPDTTGTTLAERVADSQVEVLLVVDYAESRTEQIGRLVRTLGSDSGAFRRVRLLLLARGTGGWWQDLRDDLDPQLSRARTIVLGPVDDSEQGRREAFTEAVTDLAAGLVAVQPGPDWSRLAAGVVPPPMGAPRFSTVLAVQVEALASLLRAGADPVADGGEALPEDTLLGHERRYWSKVAKGRADLPRSRRVVEAAVVTSTVVGAADLDEALATVIRLPRPSAPTASTFPMEKCPYRHTTTRHDGPPGPARRAGPDGPRWRHDVGDGAPQPRRHGWRLGPGGRTTDGSCDRDGSRRR